VFCGIDMMSALIVLRRASRHVCVISSVPHVMQMRCSVSSHGTTSSLFDLTSVVQSESIRHSWSSVWRMILKRFTRSSRYKLVAVLSYCLIIKFYIFILQVIIYFSDFRYIVASTQNVFSTEWSFMCW